jgi:AcrR family transcriptional regulator
MPRRSAAHAAETRDALLAAGRKLFAQQGFAGAGTGEISHLAGVTEGALFHHFGNKRALFEAVFEQVEAELATDAEAAMRAAMKKGSALDAFLAACRVYLDHAAQPDFARIAMIDAPVVLGIEGWRRRDSALGLAAMVRGVETLMRDGAIGRQPARPLAVLVLGALNEAGLALARGEEGISSRACLAALRRLLSTE